MAHHIVHDHKRGYLYHRRTSAGRTAYEARACWGPDLREARVFTSASAARNALNSAGGPGELVPVTLQVPLASHRLGEV